MDRVRYQVPLKMSCLIKVCTGGPWGTSKVFLSGANTTVDNPKVISCIINREDPGLVEIELDPAEFTILPVTGAPATTSMDAIGYIRLEVAGAVREYTVNKFMTFNNPPGKITCFFGSDFYRNP